MYKYTQLMCSGNLAIKGDTWKNFGLNLESHKGTSQLEYGLINGSLKNLLTISLNLFGLETGV